jgi:hypothetical protein
MFTFMPAQNQAAVNLNLTLTCMLAILSCMQIHMRECRAMHAAYSCDNVSHCGVMVWSTAHICSGINSKWECMDRIFFSLPLAIYKILILKSANANQMLIFRSVNRHWFLGQQRCVLANLSGLHYFEPKFVFLFSMTEFTFLQYLSVVLSPVLWRGPLLKNDDFFSMVYLKKGSFYDFQKGLFCEMKLLPNILFVLTPFVK